MITRSKSSTNKTNNNDNTTPTDYNSNSFPVNDVNYDDEDSWDEVSDTEFVQSTSLESIIATFCSVRECTKDHVIDVVPNVFHNLSMMRLWKYQ